ncbi:diphosphomevalonate decarboxylase [Kiritimatiellota bacterium B12222]|nr:diphosphomevalonate decarboxylase [Kiritimatiellota bacterium B12222]
MNPDLHKIISSILPHTQPRKQAGQAYAPANIALCKYWGKRQESLKLPLTGSLSISLAQLGTHMRIELSETDQLIINDEAQDIRGKAATRLFEFLSLFRAPDTHFKIKSLNTIPMAAGLASSASAFASAVNALNDLYQWELSAQQRSILARIGSGSASRSIYQGFVEWHRGEQADGMDSFAERLDTEWPDFRIGILTLSDAKKTVGSSEGMQRTIESSTLFESWPAQVDKDLPVIRQAIRDQDFDTLGKTAEQNALSMHATMISAWPPVLYWRPESVATLHQVHQLRQQGLSVYATMDAGPNVKLLFKEKTRNELLQAFPGLQVVEPFSA